MRLIYCNIDSVSGDAASLVYGRHRLANEKMRRALCETVLDWHSRAFVVCFHSCQSLYRVRLLILVNEGVMFPAENDEVAVGVPFGGGLLTVIPRPARTCGLDVANLSKDNITLDDRFCA